MCVLFSYICISIPPPLPKKKTVWSFDSRNVYVLVIMIHQNTMGLSQNSDVFVVLRSVLCNPVGSLI